MNIVYQRISKMLTENHISHDLSFEGKDSLIYVRIRDMERTVELLGELCTYQEIDSTNVVRIHIATIKPRKR